MSDANAPTGPGPARRSRTRHAALAALAAVAVAGVVYGVLSPGKTGAAACPLAASTTARLDPLVRGEVAALGLARPATVEPAVTFRTPDGQPTSLAAFKGKALLVNVWATWCVPCRQEMPALDALQRDQGGPDFQVVAVNVDTARLDGRQAFLDKNGIKGIALYADPSADILQDLKRQGGLLGLPTTLLVDRNGCEVGRMAGPAAWDSADGQAMIRALKG